MKYKAYSYSFKASKAQELLKAEAITEHLSLLTAANTFYSFVASFNKDALCDEGITFSKYHTYLVSR